VTKGVPITELGSRLRDARTRAGLSLRALASRLDVSASALSQIETGRSHPSVATLYSLAAELGVGLDTLFAGDGLPTAAVAPNPSIRRVDARSSLELMSGVRWEQMASCRGSGIQFLYVVYEPASSSSGEPVSHEGREYGVVLEGCLTVTIGQNRYVLAAGDSIAFDSTTPHRLVNDTSVPACAVWTTFMQPEA
jgi:transcriptional regulator with XRE-family HTH domain